MTKEKQPARRLIALPEQLATEMAELSAHTGIPISKVRRVVEEHVADYLTTFDLRAALRDALLG